MHLLQPYRINLHSDLLPYLSRLPRLESFLWTRLWDPSEGISSQTTLKIARDIGSACPALKRVLWVDGTLALLERNGTGEVVGVNKFGSSSW